MKSFAFVVFGLSIWMVGIALSCIATALIADVGHWLIRVIF